MYIYTQFTIIDPTQSPSLKEQEKGSVDLTQAKHCGEMLRFNYFAKQKSTSES